MTRYTRRAFVPAFALLGLGVATAPAFGGAAPNIATYRGPDRAQRILDGARREGRVAFYAGMIEAQALRPLVDAFRRKYPFMAVDAWRGDSRALVQKSMAEMRARRVAGDVLESTGGAEALVRAGAVQPFYSPETAAFDPQHTDPDGMWAASRLDHFGMAYNTRLVPAAEVPKTFEDLLDPKWRGAMAWRADSEVGAALFIAGVLRHRGKERGEDYLRRLAQQRIVNYAGSPRALVDRVGAGEYRLALEIYAHHPIISQARGAPLDVQMFDPVHSSVSTIQLAKDAPHPHAAMLLIDFALSAEGQQVLAGAQYLPPHPGVETDPALRKIIPHLNGQQEIVFTPATLFESRTEANAIFNRYFR